MTTPAALKPAAVAEDDDRCLIRSRTEILFLLRGIMKQNSLITLYFNGGKEFILTSVLHVDPDANALILDVGPDRELNDRMFKSERLLVTTTHEQVKVKFSGSQPTRVKFDGDLALRMPIPPDLYRLQRREYYRVATGIVKPLKCSIPVPAEEAEAVADVIILDISCGGIALMDQHHAVDLEPGNRYAQCRITLPDIGPIVAELEVRNTYQATLRNGMAYKRSGCQFVGIRESERGLIQRYITKLEREKVR